MSDGRQDAMAVPGGVIRRMPGEDYDTFGRRVDALRLSARQNAQKREDHEHVMNWRDHMANCFDVPLGERPIPSNGKP